jgi:hypothetical protein
MSTLTLTTLLIPLLRHRLTAHFGQKKNASPPLLHPEAGDDSLVARIVHTHGLSVDEFALLCIALAPHLAPQFLDTIIQESLPQPGDFPQIGGVRGKNFRGFLPTGETALFLLAGDDPGKRLEVQQLFSEDHLFAKKHILWLEEVPEGEPHMSGRIILSQEYVDLFTIGKVARPRFSMNFPAQLLETGLEWDDLVLHSDTLEQIKELEVWVKHGDTLLHDWEMHRKLKPGYRALFHGPPGTGKTLTASLLGKYTGKDVYRIDLSMMVSKFIGETEKNLSNLFSKAENKDWILFFDEADALFGKRTNVRDAHDKYANQEVSYLLQRVEHYNGLVILATNFKSNIDEAFSRRFQSIIYFPMPGTGERLRLWQKAFPEKIQLAQDINLPTFAQKYELTGAEIINVVQYACLRALDRDGEQILFTDLHDGIKKEFQKEGRIMR